MKCQNLLTFLFERDISLRKTKGNQLFDENGRKKKFEVFTYGRDFTISHPPESLPLEPALVVQEEPGALREGGCGASVACQEG